MVLPKKKKKNSCIGKKCLDGVAVFMLHVYGSLWR